MEGKYNGSLLDQVSNLRVQRLMHYKCNTDWDHEFIRADIFNKENKCSLTMLWERDLPLRGGKSETKRDYKLKLGLQCESIDRVTYISQSDLGQFMKMKDAVCLRYVWLCIRSNMLSPTRLI